MIEAGQWLSLTKRNLCGVLEMIIPAMLIFDICDVCVTQPAFVVIMIRDAFVYGSDERLGWRPGGSSPPAVMCQPLACLCMSLHFVWQCPRVWRLRTRLHIPDLFKAYPSHLANLLLSPNSGPSCNNLLSSSKHLHWKHWLPLWTRHKTADWCLGLFVLTTTAFTPQLLRWHWLFYAELLNIQA